VFTDYNSQNRNTT